MARQTKATEPQEQLAWSLVDTETYESAQYGRRAGYHRVLELQARVVRDGKADLLDYHHDLRDLRLTARQSTQSDYDEPLGTSSYGGIGYRDVYTIDFDTAVKMARILGTIDRAITKASETMPDWPARVGVVAQALGIAWFERPSTENERRWQGAGASVVIPLKAGITWLREQCASWRPVERRLAHEYEHPVFTCESCGGVYEGWREDKSPYVCAPCENRSRNEQWQAQQREREAQAATASPWAGTDIMIAEAAEAAA